MGADLDFQDALDEVQNRIDNNCILPAVVGAALMSEYQSRNPGVPAITEHEQVELLGMMLLC